jgi:ketosteroid isomerase-like protein
MTLEEMEKRLRAVEDIEAIKQLQIRYVNYLMLADWDEIMDCFAEDCILDVFVDRDKTQGKAAIERVFREVVSVKHTGSEGDIIVHPLITVNGDRASGNWVIYFLGAETEGWKAPGWIRGQYDAEYVREKNGQWKFSMLKWRPTLMPGQEIPPA